MRRRSSQRGFTLVELMVSLVVFSFAMVGILAVGVSMTNGFREQRDAVTAESLVRLPLDYLTDAIRQASPAVPGFNISDANTCSLSALTVTDSSTGPDTLDVIYAVGGIVTETKTALTGSTVDIVDPTGLAANDFVVISNITQGHFFKIQSIAGNTLTLQENCAGFALPTGGYPAGSIVVRSVHATFSIGAIDAFANGLLMDPDSASASNAPALAEPLAENIEDMQIAVGIDQDGLGLNSPVESGVLGNDDDWVFNNSADTVPAWPPVAPGIIRAVRITLVAKSASKDVGNSGSYTRPAAEDRAAGALDNYRRRVLKSTVEFRNVGASP